MKMETKFLCLIETGQVQIDCFYILIYMKSIINIIIFKGEEVKRLISDCSNDLPRSSINRD